MSRRPLHEVIGMPAAADGPGIVQEPAPVAPVVRGQRVRADARKDVMLWPDQQQSLNHLAWRVSRMKPAGVGERITANTLIRVAVDLLLARADEVHGTTEQEILRNLSDGD